MTGDIKSLRSSRSDREVVVMGYGDHWSPGTASQDIRGPVRTTIGIVIVQVVFNSLAAFMLFGAASALPPAEQAQADGLVWLGVLSLAITALLIVAVIGLREGRAWSRGMTTAMEIVSIAGSTLALLSGNPFA